VRLSSEEGFSLVEMVIASMLFLVVATTLLAVLTSGIVMSSATRERTLAVLGANAKVESIRKMPYDNVGTPSGNPSGTVVAGEPLKVNGVVPTGLQATVTTKIGWVDDKTPTGYATAANYKKVTVTVTRDRDAKQLAKVVTYVSASVLPEYGGINQAIVKARIVDFDATAVVGALVQLSGGPSGTRSDVTDDAGEVTFPSLIPNPTSGATAYYDLTVTPPTGYTVHPSDVSPASAAHLQLSPGQTASTSIRVFRPATSILASVAAPPKNPSTNVNVAYTAHIGSALAAESFSQTAGATSRTITTLGGKTLSPYATPYGVGLTANVSTTNYFFAGVTPTTAFPNAYPTDLTKTFTLPNGTWYAAAATKVLTVSVTAGGVAQSGARVVVTGQPTSPTGASPVFVTGTTTTAGTVAIRVPQSTTYSIRAWSSDWTKTTPATLPTQAVGTANVTKAVTIS
jgi:hypothetical protein